MSDVADRTAPAVVTQTVFDGNYRDARAVDGTVYLVMDRSLNLPAGLVPGA
ncbi:MAG: beta-propeller domain-containing protein [Kiritimatiellia bacterium]